MNRTALAVLTLLLLLAPIAAAEEATAPRDLVQRMLDTTDEKTRASLKAALIAAGPDPAQVAGWFAEGRVYAETPPTGIQRLWIRGDDGVDRPYVLYVPEAYVSTKKHRLIIDLHGGVSRGTALTHEQLLRGMGYFWGQYCMENACLLAWPSGQSGAEWWTDRGAKNVLGILRETKRSYNVDEDLVFASGFSDGASGDYYLALTHPTPFAGFIALNGAIPVAGARGLQVYMRNLINTPIYAVNTEKDTLYPSAQMKTFFDALKELGAPVVWRDVPEFAHDPRYLPKERPAIVTWMHGIRRNANPKRIVWEGMPGSPSRVHSLKVLRHRDAEGGAEFPDVNPMVGPGRVLIGINVDTNFTGIGAKVTGVGDETAAQAVGLQVGDVITGIDDTEITSLTDLRGALGKKNHGDAFRVRFRRGEETIEKAGKFPPPKSRPVFTRAGPHGSIEAVVEGNRITVRTRRIDAFEVYLGPHLVDLAKPVEVVVNGTSVHAGIVKPDLAFLIDKALEEEDRGTVSLARLQITVPAPKGD